MNLKLLNEISEYIFFDKSEENTCSICLEKLNNTGRKLKCNHIFHIQCIDNWLIDHNTCPICRDEINIESNNDSNISDDIASMMRYNLYIDGINTTVSCFLLYSIIRYSKYRMKIFGYWTGIAFGIPFGILGGIFIISSPIILPFYFY